MKTIFEKSFVSADQASKAATKELGEKWSKGHIVAKGDKGRYVIQVRAKKEKQTKAAKPINPDKLTRKQFAELKKCPCCESEDIFYGHAPEGVVVGEDQHVGCHACGWEFSFATPKRMSDALNSARKSYVKVLSYAGTMSADNNDEIAELLRGLNPDQVCAVADIVKGKAGGFYATRYASLNIGQRRMNAGNVIRAAVKNGEASAAQVRVAVDTLGAAGDEEQAA